MMECFLLLDVSFGFWDYLRFPIIGIPVALIGILLIFLGVRAIRRELRKKNEVPAEAAPMIESEDPENEPLPESGAQAAEPPADAAAEENKTE